MITIGLLAIVLWRTDAARWVRWLGVAALALVVISKACSAACACVLDERTLAMLHGCTGPLFFALTRGDWSCSRRAAGGTAQPTAHPLQSARFAAWPSSRASWSTCRSCSARCCATCRSPPSRRHLPLAVRFHLFLAAILSLHIVLLVVARAVTAHDASNRLAA